MADGTDWSIAAQVKPQTSADIVSPLTAFANSELARARTQEVALQARQANAAFGARQTYLDLLNSGANPEDAIVKSGLSAIDPANADQALKNVSQQREIGAIRGYDPNNPASVAAGGPALVGTAATALGTEATTQKTKADTGKLNLDNQGQVLQLMGQHGQAFLADPTLENWNAQVQSARDHGLISDLTAQQYWGKPDVGIAKSWAAAGASSVTTSGIAEENQGAAKAKYLTEKVSPGEGIAMTPAAAAAAGGGSTSAAVMPGSPAVGAQPPAATPVAAPIYGRAATAADGFSPAGLARVAQIESGGNPNAVNAGSKAAGLMQFIPSSWQQYGQGSPFDPQASADAAQRMAADNKKALTGALGRALTDAELYLAHQQGAGGAAALLANPNARAADIVGMSAVISNGGSPNMTAGQFASKWINQFNRTGGGNFSVSGPQAGGLAMTMPPGTNPAPAQIAPIASPVLAASSPGASPGQLAAPPQAAAPAPVAAAAPPAAAPIAPVAPAAPLAPGVVAPQPAAPQGSPLTMVMPGLSVQQRSLQEGLGTQGADQVKAAREGFQAAQVGQQNLQQLQSDLAKLPESGGGMLAPGNGATERIGLAKGINTAFTALGIAPPFDPEKISAAEGAQKITGRLGFDLSRTLGSREAVDIVKQAITLNPGVENTPQGARVITASLNAALQRSKDFYVFQQQYMSDPRSGGSPLGAEIAFDQAHPVGQYVQDVQKLARVPAPAVEYLQQHANDPQTVAAFDKTYGAGIARYFSSVGTQ